MKNLPIAEIRRRANVFSEKWKNETYEKGETHSFYDDFFRVFGNERYGIAQYEKPVGKFGEDGGFIDLFYPGVLLAEQKSAGRDLGGAKIQADGYFVHLKEEEKPRYILTCDFQNFRLHDSIKNRSDEFKLSELSENIHLFEFMQNVETAVEQYYVSVNTKVTESMGDVYNSLKDKRYNSPDVEKFLTRITFCMFAEDMSIFNVKSFQKFIQDNTSEHGHDLGEKLHRLFEILNTPKSERQMDLDEEYAQFPYINGDLFKENIRTPQCDQMIRDRIIDACKHDWSDISPVIFGSLFQTIMKEDERRSLGAHYTEEKNILKVIRPLFLDGLREKFNKIKKISGRLKKKELEKFQDMLAGLTFFDPACGAGNFLIIAYREIRRLEMDAISELRQDQVIAGDAAELLSKINVSQFHGIEIGDFSTQIAQTALWMMDHKMNMELSDKFGESYTRIPLGKSPNIKNTDALEIDWNEIIPAGKCSYVFGNPPFGGIRELDNKQNEQLSRIVSLGKHSGMPDYVMAWFIKAAEYISTKTPFGFVATNSITQGAQVDTFSKILLRRHKLEIIFAHRSFKWYSQAKGKAQVIVVIIGMAKKYNGVKYLFDNDKKQQVKNITPYLASSEDQNTVVRRVSKPINGLPDILIKGMAITDNGNYVFDEYGKTNFLKKEPNTAPYFRPHVTARGFLYGIKQWVLLVYKIPPNEMSKMPKVRELLIKVAEFRKRSRKEATVRLGWEPKEFERPIIPKKRFMVIPVVSSENRSYLPIGFANPPKIASAATIIGEGASLGLFTLLITKMHMLWLKTGGGRLKNDLRYSNIVYNTFPVPKEYDSLKKHGRDVLNIRNKYPNSTLADLYDPITMPHDLKKAHDRLDKAMDKMYRQKPFKSDQERVQFLLGEYEKMTSKS